MVEKVLQEQDGDEGFLEYSRKDAKDSDSEEPGSATVSVNVSNTESSHTSPSEPGSSSTADIHAPEPIQQMYLQTSMCQTGNIKALISSEPSHLT